MTSPAVRVSAKHMGGIKRRQRGRDHADLNAFGLTPGFRAFTTRDATGKGYSRTEIGSDHRHFVQMIALAVFGHLVGQVVNVHAQA